MRSLKATLVCSTMAGTLAVVLTVGGVIYWLVKIDATQQFDRSLHATARLLCGAVVRTTSRVKLEFDDLDMREFSGSGEPAYLEIWLANGSVLYRSRSLGHADLIPFGGALKAPQVRPINLPDGSMGRAIGITFTPRMDDDDDDDHAEHERDRKRKAAQHVAGQPAARAVTVVIARGTLSMDRMMWHLAVILLLVGGIGVAILGGVLWLTIRRGLQPLNQLAGRIARLGEHDLSARVEMDDAPRELEPVLGRLNSLLSQLEAAFDRERAFSANVAHELRTPLAALGMKQDVALSKERDSREYETVLRTCRQLTGDMAGMVDNLLTLARLESGRITLQTTTLDLNTLFESCWQPLQSAADARRLRVDWKLETPSTVIGDPGLLQLTLRNLLENAVQYAGEAGDVRIATRQIDNRIEIRIQNTGSRVKPEDAERVFDRFWRGDTARSEAGSHCGLGLALARKCVLLLNGEITAKSSAGNTFEITAVVPSSESPQS